MKRGLGRGLDKLLGASSAPAAASSAPAASAPLQIEISRLHPGNAQPRRRFAMEELRAMAETIRRQGVIQPLIVRPAKDGYEIIAGERRWRAAQIAGLKTAPAVVRELSDREALLFALVENIQRADLNAAEQARGIERMLKETGMTHAQASEHLGMSRPAITNLLRLLSLAAPVLRMVEEGKLGGGHARALLPLPPAGQTEAAREIAAKNMTARAAESLVKRMLAGNARRVPAAPDADTRRLESDLSAALSARVEIRHNAKNKNGKLTVHYGNLTALDRLLAKLRK
ncbi:MAG: ParB/RepB/Spo0J family partition protein [Gammaproteobacteria bacterium]